MINLIKELGFSRKNDSETLDDFKRVISSCIRDGYRKTINDVEIINIEKWKSGSKSTIYRLPIRIHFPSGKDLSDYLLKKYHNPFDKRIISERRISAISNEIPLQKYDFAMGREIKVFPKLFFDNDHSLLEKGISFMKEEEKPMLNEKLKEKNQISWELTASKALEPLILLSDFLFTFAKYDLHIEDPFKIQGIPNPDAAYFTCKFEKSIEKIFDNKKIEINFDKLSPRFYEIASKYLSCEENNPQQNKTFVQEQAYPSHNNLFSLIDAGEVIIGSRLLSFGSLYGDEELESKLDKKNEELIKSVYNGYMLRREELHSHEKHLSPFYIGENEFATGFSLAAAYSNILRSAEYLKKQIAGFENKSDNYLLNGISHLEKIINFDIGTHEDKKKVYEMLGELKAIKEKKNDN